MRELPAVAILCGGRGTRLQTAGAPLPKALVEVGGRPILWHVIGLYLAAGFRRFVLLTGYLATMIEQFAAATAWAAEVSVQCLDTGLDTPTGGRVLRALRNGTLEDRFCLTYADGVADLDLRALLAAHAAHAANGGVGTLTVVRPALQFGVASLDADGLVRGFIEKPRSEHWVNGGFMCFEPALVELLSEDCALEREPLSQLARQGRLAAFRHEGFWQCMDTYKDAAALEELWAMGEAPWRTSAGAGCSPGAGCAGRSDHG